MPLNSHVVTPGVAEALDSMHYGRQPIQKDRSGSLVAALTATTNEPLVLLDRDMCVVTASRAYLKMFPINFARQDHPFCELGSSPIDVPTFQALRDAISRNTAIEDLEFELDVHDLRRRTIRLNACPISDDTVPEIAMLVRLEDMTALRMAAERTEAHARRQEILLMEAHHRIANSLQIVASVLLLKARSVESGEARILLREVHKRLIVIATVQRQLCKPGAVEDIELGTYLTQLFDGLANSIVAEDGPVTIAASASAGTINPEDAVSIGLIATELVINALKHGFPNGRGGHIDVAFVADGEDWRLSVIDDGVGRQLATVRPAHSGLGTSIVETLARHLKAEVTIAIDGPGYATVIAHKGDGGRS